MSEGGFDALVQEIFDRLERIEDRLDDILAIRGGSPESSVNTIPAKVTRPLELLTEDEHRAVAMAGELWGLLCKITADGQARDGDLQELIAHVHAIQRAVLKQAAARAYPDLYRLLGGDMINPESRT